MHQVVQYSIKLHWAVSLSVYDDSEDSTLVFLMWIIRNNLADPNCLCEAIYGCRKLRDYTILSYFISKQLTNETTMIADSIGANPLGDRCPRWKTRSWRSSCNRIRQTRQWYWQSTRNIKDSQSSKKYKVSRQTLTYMLFLGFQRLTSLSFPPKYDIYWDSMADLHGHLETTIHLP